MTFVDIRDKFIAQVVSGKSFVDIGGLHMIVGEKLSVAKEHGAREVSIVDVTARESGAWQSLSDHLAAKGLKEYKTYSTDILNFSSRPFDVVHSSGVLYHLINPMEYLIKLRSLTNEHAIVTSAITQPRIENSKGVFEIPASGIIFVPALSTQEREVLAEYWRQFGNVIGITEPCEYELERYDPPWWFLPTVPAFKSMCKCARFEILAEGPFWEGNAYTLLLR